MRILISANILHEFTGWLQGLTMLVLTIPMLLLGFYFLGRFRFLIRASYVTLIYSLGVDVLVGAIFGWEMALYAFVTLFMWGLVADYVMEGPSMVRTAFIVTDAPETVSQALLNRMGVGVTGWEGKGMFSKTNHMTLFCAVNRPDVRRLTAIVNEVDPRTFVVIAQGHQAKGGRLRQVVHTNSRKKRSKQLAAKSLDDL